MHFLASVTKLNRAPVAQMDRALASGAKGRGFEPLQARHFFLGPDRPASAYVNLRPYTYVCQALSCCLTSSFQPLDFRCSQL